MKLEKIFNNYLFIAAFFPFFVKDLYAIDSKSDREKLVSARSRKFYQSSRVKQSLMLSGNYSSDWNSKEYQFDLRYFYQSDRQIHEFYFLREIKYANLSTTPGKTHLVKKTDRYDATLSNKFVLFDTKNYGVLYNRMNQDDLAVFQYDFRTAAGIGRMFFDDKIEIDGSFGFNETGAYGNKFFFLPSTRINLKLSQDITLTQRAFVFVNHKSTDTDVKTTLKFRLDDKKSFVINHSFEQRRYDNNKKRIAINESSRYVAIGFVFDLE
jgi:hypothetical protein